MESLVADPNPDIAYPAAAITEVFLTRMQAGDEGIQRWEALPKPPGYGLAAALGGARLEQLLARYTSEEFSRQVSGARTLATSSSGGPLEGRASADAFLLGLMQQLAVAVRD